MYDAAAASASGAALVTRRPIRSAAPRTTTPPLALPLPRAITGTLQLAWQ
uniref:Uncharacterized protein n=1 Tax=Arundo donax TaxID=35708 RepID=A0A0A9F7Q0_ARUDO